MSDFLISLGVTTKTRTSRPRTKGWCLGLGLRPRSRHKNVSRLSQGNTLCRTLASLLRSLAKGEGATWTSEPCLASMLRQRQDLSVHVNVWRRATKCGVAVVWILGLTIKKMCRRGRSMFWHPKMSHSFIRKCCWITASFTSSRMEDLCHNER